MLLGWRCPVCGAAGAVPCATCRAQFRTAGPIRPIAGVDWCAALLSYRGPARELVARLKFRNQRAAVGWLAEGMAALVGHREFDVVTWAPANPAHLRQRGFDHGELLARAIARRLDLPVARLLERGRGASLTGRSAAQRHGGPPLRATKADRAYPLCGVTVLVVDDVITTGATLSTAATRLRGVGAAGVIGLAAAYTPMK